MTIQRTELTRRQLVGAAGASLAAAAVARVFPAIAQHRTLKIGALISQADAQGQDEMIQPYDQQMKLGLELAVAEINAAGGILGRQVELLIADDDGSPAPGAAAAVKMIKEQGVEALVSGLVMAIRSFMDRTLQAEKLNIPVIHALQTEGTYCGRVAHVAPTTLQAISTLVQHLGAAARQRTFQMSDWSPSQRIVSQQFYDHVQGGATGVALVTTPVTGNSPGEYRGVVRWAQELNAKNFWISVPRPYAVNVVRQAYEIGLGPNFNYHFLDFSEWQASQLPEGATAWTAVPFVASDDHPAVRDFVSRARRRSGHDLVTHVAFTHYNAIQELKVAMEKAGTTAGDKVMAALDGATLSTATGPVVMGKGRYASMPIYVARATRRTFEVVKKYDAVATGSTCA